MKFDIIVPAHNEAAVIARTVANLRSVDWPVDQFRVVVIAHNCSDETAERAMAAGAIVLVKNQLPARGKGDALDFAFAELRREGWASAFAVVDADTCVSGNFLEAIACRFEAGEQAVQVHYGVLNPESSWRTRLLTIAKACFHQVRSRARERLGLSSGIRGTGWSVLVDVFNQVPYAAFSITEDIEFGLALGRAGIRVAYADEADARAEMVVAVDAAGRQRQRWEHGRMQLLKSSTTGLLRDAFRRRSLSCLDLAIDLLVLPLSYVILGLVALALLAAVGVALDLSPIFWLWVSAGCGVCLVLHVLRGWQLSGIGLRGIADLARVPMFLFWKLRVMLRPHERGVWVRTDRDSQ